MQRHFHVRFILGFIVIGLLCGCGGSNTIRGEFTQDLRAEDQRTLVVWPHESEVPRYRYLGELVGEPNFVDSGRDKRPPVVAALQWLAGVNEKVSPVVLHRPQHGTVDDKGRIYVADAGRNAVFVFDPTAPADEESDRGAGRLLVWNYATPRTRFQGPVAVASVWGGDIAVSDSALGIVARINQSGIPVAQIGAGKVKRPTGLAFDAARGLLFVADTAANDVKVFDEGGTLINVVGSPGEGSGKFNAPTHLAYADGHLYVSDTLNNRVQVFDSEGSYLFQFGDRGLNVGDLARPKGIAVGSGGVVYVIESYFGYLLAYSHSGEFLIGINGSGLQGGQFLLPAGVWTDKDGRVFVADMLNGRVVVFQFLGHDDD